MENRPSQGREIPSFTAGFVSLNPCRQLQLYTPIPLVQLEYGPQMSGLSSHSSMSARGQSTGVINHHTQNNNTNSEY